MIDALFAPDGAVAKSFKGFETRPGQTRMAAAVARAVAEKKHVAIEAPCGIGKTFAYLLPAVEHAIRTDGRVVVCTANIALQEQIFEKDLPAIGKILGKKFNYALIKGLNNYLCLDRFHETAEELPTVTFDRRQLRHFQKITAWADETKSGDLSDLDLEPDEAVWHRVNGVSDLCNGPRCRFYDECFAMDARRKLRNAQVIVTNYHLFFAHVRVKSLGAGDVILPPASTVICDEAHDMADIARDFFGLRLGPFSIAPLAKGAAWLKKGGVAERLRQASREFFGRVRDASDRRLRKPKWINADGLQRALGEYVTLLAEEKARTHEDDEERRDKIGKFAMGVETYADTLDAFLRVDDKNSVYWVERDDRAARLHARAIDVSSTLDEHLFKTTPTVVLTSATLTANGKFDFIKRETGAAEVEELRVDSPFDFQEQAILVVPRMKCLPNDPGFAAEMSVHINRVIKLLGGRTMCLFTSWKNLEACATAAEATGVEILRQGDKPRSKLLAKFRKDEGTALFGTSSFWQGVDVPGEALSCLMIDKIPFMNPGDPLLEALQERDPACFSNYSLPKAILDLRQGFGRLIRRRSDRGVVVIFDTRLFTKSYGPEVLASLPGAAVHRDLEALEKFFQSESAPVE
ncbi:MAG TPA: ATP-dependent DNA helicase [Planctomycetota bacterium]